MFLLYLIRALLLSQSALAIENLALRQQLAVLKRSVPRPRIRWRDRVFFVALRRLWTGWRNCLIVVQPETVARWHRQGWRLFWRLRCGGGRGRPKLSIETRDLIRRLSRENRLWGAPRIQAELARLGFHVAKSTIEIYMTRRTDPPSGKWRAFMRNHAGEILACDFFIIPTATFKTLIGFVVIELGRRRIVACDVTEHPTASWAAAVVQRAMLAVGRRAKFLVRDRDAIYGAEFRRVIKALGLKQMVSAYHSPLQNAYAERVIGTLRRECLDHVIVLGGRHARRILHEFVEEYYNPERPHQALKGDSPVPRADLPVENGRVISFEHLGGLHHSYRRVA